MPAYRRLTADSAAACEKLVNERLPTAASSDGTVKAMLSVPKKLLSTVAAAPLNVLWPEVYEGKFGVTSSGAQVGSAVVAEFPSVSAARMAVTGRQRLSTYLASQQAMAASARAMLSSANRRAFWERVLPRA